jgi:hypothetical protein
MIQKDKEKEQEEVTMKNPIHQEPLLQVQAPPLEWIAVNDAILARLDSLSQSPHEVNRSTARLLHLFQQRLLTPISSPTTLEVPPTPHSIEQMLLRLNQARRQAAKVIHDDTAHKQQQQIVQQCWHWFSTHQLLLVQERVSGEWQVAQGEKR